MCILFLQRGHCFFHHLTVFSPYWALHPLAAPLPIQIRIVFTQTDACTGLAPLLGLNVISPKVGGFEDYPNTCTKFDFRATHELYPPCITHRGPDSTRAFTITRLVYFGFFYERRVVHPFHPHCQSGVRNFPPLCSAYLTVAFLGGLQVLKLSKMKSLGPVLVTRTS